MNRIRFVDELVDPGIVAVRHVNVIFRQFTGFSLYGVNVETFI